MSADTDREALKVFAKTDLGREFVELVLKKGAEIDAQDAAAAERAARDKEFSRRRDAISAEHAAFDAAGLTSLTGTDDDGHVPGGWTQRVALLNTRAHPTALAAAALSRAERVQAFARVLEACGLVEGDEAESAVFTLARMTEEVTALLQALIVHDGFRNALLPTREAA